MTGLLHRSPQDDSDDEVPCVKRPPSRKRQWRDSVGEEFIEYSCEEGEETSASSEVRLTPDQYSL